jgi:hypothetical protein
MLYLVFMYIEHVPNRNSPPAILLRESYRDGNKVKKRTLANLSEVPSIFRLPAGGFYAARSS